MGNGTVQYPYYKNGGKYVKHGLRNKRKAYWRKIREAEQREKERKAKAAEQAQREWDEEFHPQNRWADAAD
jgi:hypothetical protein